MRLPERLPPSSSTAPPGDANTVPEAIAEVEGELGGGPPPPVDGLPRQHTAPEQPELAAGCFEPSVAAVLLGATAVAVVGAPVEANAQEILSTESAHELATRIDSDREGMSTTELADARRSAWSAFVAEGSGPSAVAASTGAVGQGAANSKEDVRRVQARLQELGFKVTTDGNWGAKTKRAIMVFEASLTGVESISSGSGKVIPGGALHHTLFSSHAPRWVKLPASGTGWVNGDTDGHSHATSRLQDTLSDAARRYHDGHMAAHPGAAPMKTNDASLPAGGDTKDHESHEAGLDLDVLLPHRNGTSGAVVGWRSYDRDATYAMIAAFAQNARVERIYIGDSVLLQRVAQSGAAWKHKVQDGGSLHNDHFHVDIAPVGYAPTVN